MLEWILPIVIGGIIGAVIVKLAQNDKTVDSVKMFTDEEYLEKSFNKAKDKAEDKINQFMNWKN